MFSRSRFRREITTNGDMGGFVRASLKKAPQACAKVTEVAVFQFTSVVDCDPNCTLCFSCLSCESDNCRLINVSIFLNFSTLLIIAPIGRCLWDLIYATLWHHLATSLNILPRMQSMKPFIV